VLAVNKNKEMKMQRKAPKFDRYFLTSRTNMAKSRVDDTIKRARMVEADEDKERRLGRQYCKACHYFPRIAGQAFTEQHCACCGVSQMHSSTDTEALCLPCAEQHTLCKHCGGDLEMRTGRRNWPEVTVPN
jgi:hypothetical protein